MQKETTHALLIILFSWVVPVSLNKGIIPYQFPVQIITTSNSPPLIATLLALCTRIKCLVGAAEAN
jgi:hypothetical protein